MKKFLILLICLSLALGIFSACRRTPDENETTTDIQETTENIQSTETIETQQVTLGYYKGKALNPFTTESPTNRRLMTLVYDSLFILSENYTAEPLVAESYFIEGTALTVTLRADSLFSDGSPITPSDVVYSFNAAKNSENYKGLLTDFVSANASTDSVLFTLARGNASCCNNLIFPIIKFGTLEQDIPLGSGRYTFVSKQDTFFLEANENSTRNEEMSLKEIKLIPITSEAKELYLLQTGDLSYFFDDLTDGEYIKIGANTATINLNNMVYLGYNSKSSRLSDKSLLAAMSFALDRDELIQNCYGGMGKSTDLPFNPQWQSVQDMNNPPVKKDTALSDELFKKSGYVYAYGNNKYRSKNFEFLELTMIVNTESAPKLSCAKEVKKQLEQAGVNVKLIELEFEDYIDALYDGEYDLYIGEVKLSPDMNLSSFFTEGGSTAYGINSQSACSEAYFDFLAGEIDITTFIQVFELERPFIPLLFRNAVSYYSREITYEEGINEYEPFKNIYSWGFASQGK